MYFRGEFYLAKSGVYLVDFKNVSYLKIDENSFRGVVPSCQSKEFKKLLFLGKGYHKIYLIYIHGSETSGQIIY